MAHDVFISYASEDKQVADKVCDELERDGVKCWIAPRDVPPGVSYEQAILDGIEASTFLILVFSSHTNTSHHVEREVRKSFEECSRTQVIPFRLEDIPYNKTLYYYLGGAQWIDASTPPLEQHLNRLVEHVRSRLSRADGEAKAVESSTYVKPPDSSRDYDSFKGTGDGTKVFKGTGDGRKPFPFALVGAGVLALLLVAVVVAVVAMRGDRDNRNTLPVNNANINNATPTPQRSPTPSPTPSASPTPSPRPPIRNINRTTLNFNLRRPLNRNN